MIGPGEIISLLYILLFVVLVGGLLWLIATYLPQWNAPQPLKVTLGAVVVIAAIFVILRILNII